MFWVLKELCILVMPPTILQGNSIDNLFIPFFIQKSLPKWLPSIKIQWMMVSGGRQTKMRHMPCPYAHSLAWFNLSGVACYCWEKKVESGWLKWGVIHPFVVTHHLRTITEVSKSKYFLKLILGSLMRQFFLTLPPFPPSDSEFGMS